MARLRVLPLEEDVELKEPDTILEALHRAGIDLEGPCNGEGTCGNCRIWVEDPRGVPETPHRYITREQADEGLRLACQLRPEKDLTIRLPSDFINDPERMRRAQRILVGGRISRLRISPAVSVYQEGGKYKVRYDRLPEPELLDIWHVRDESPKGLAIDLGTTTLVVTLLSLQTGRELATASRLNPQIRFGHDVMSRIKEGSTDEGLAALAEAVQGGLNQLLKQVCADSGSSPREILDVVIGGNTTMLQLAAGIDPAPLGHIPFKVGIQGGTSYPAGKFGLDINARARVYIPPVAHAFVGSDISAGLLVSGGFFDEQESILFIDVGTNGEMALSAGGTRTMTSTAAGPAFEGMGLSHGMRAAVGAVEAIRMIEGGALEIVTIGDADPKGICGSGMIDLLASLLKMGVVEPSGRMMRKGESKDMAPELSRMLEDLSGMAAFRLGDGVYITQEDVRQVQLAKAAIRAAMDLLMKESGVEGGSLEKIVIAGGFGYSLNPVSLEIIGMIPPGTGDKMTFAGNSSRIGSAWLLMDVAWRRFLEERMGDVKHVSIAESPDFMECYVGNMDFPDPGRGHGIS